MREISSAAKRVARSLFPDESDQQTFLQFLLRADGGRSSVQFVNTPSQLPDWSGELTPWGMPDNFFVIDSRAAALDHLHTSGACYLLEASSVFMASPASLLLGRPINKFLDVCASPGGKSILIGTVLKPAKHIANEFVKKRLGSLHANLKRCHMEGTQIVSMDTGQLAANLGSDFDFVVVDAPCSGQSLEMRGEKSPGCFLDVTVNKCAMRQRRILANSAACVAQGGYLLYSTCTFSFEENEKVISWFLKQHPEYATVAIPLLSKHRSALSQEDTYRLHPQQLSGAGGFTCMLQKS